MAQPRRTALFDRAIVRAAIGDSFRKLDPRLQAQNPVMFVVLVGAVLVSVLLVRDVARGKDVLFNLQIALWLWFTLLFANFAEAMAEGRGKAQAAALRRGRTETIGAPGHPQGRGAGPGDEPPQGRPGHRRGREASSRATGPSSRASPRSTSRRSPASRRPVIRESGGDRSAVTGGTRVLSDRIVVEITSNPGETFLDRMIALVEGASRQKTPNEIALSILLAGLTIVFLIATVTLRPVRALRQGRRHDAGPHRAARLPDPDDDRRPALGDRHRGHGPRAPAQRARDVRPRGRGGRRRQRPAPRQDRDDHARQPPGDRLLPAPARAARRPRGGGAALLALRRDAGGPLDRRPRQGEVRPARAAHGGHEVHPLLGDRPACRAWTSTGARSARARATPWPSGSAARAARSIRSCRTS